MKKKIFALALAVAMILTVAVLLSACKQEEAPKRAAENIEEVEAKAAEEARDSYALSAVTGVSYLASVGGGLQGLSAPVDNASPTLLDSAVRPEGLSDPVLGNIKSCLTAFDALISGTGFEHTVKANTSADPRFSGYTHEMTITLHHADATVGEYKMYFTETNTRTEKEVEHGREEIEIKTAFEGVVLFMEEIYLVKGVRELETEGTESDTALEFGLYKNVGTDTLQADESNFVLIEQSFEKGEAEYEYTLMRNGRKLMEFELEYESGPRGTVITVSAENSLLGESEFTIRRGTEDHTFTIESEWNDRKNTIHVVKGENGEYRFTYANGFEESVQ